MEKNNFRIIARLDIKNNFVIKGIHLEGLRKVGNPNDLALKYYEQGADEIIMMDAVASLYDRNNLFDIVKKACKGIFIPIAVGGGIRNIDDVSLALDAGADKVVVNTAFIKNINLVSQIAKKYGSQCLIGSIEAKKLKDNWFAYFNNGRESTNLNVIDWAKILEDNGVGEILITSIDQEGTSKGFDIELSKKIYKATNCPIIISGGYGLPKHLDSLIEEFTPSAISIAGALHYNKTTINEIKNKYY